MNRAQKIAAAVEFLRENEGEDRATVIELLKDEGLSGNEVVDALAQASQEGK